MCTGIEIAVGAMLVGTAVQGVGSVMGGNAAKDSATRQAAVNEDNAKKAEAQAVDAVITAELPAQKAGEEAAVLKARQRIAFVAGNFDVTSGTPADIAAGTAARASEAESWARLEGARAAYGYRAQAEHYRAVGAANLADGDAAQTAGYLGAVGGVLSGLGHAGAAAKGRG